MTDNLFLIAAAAVLVWLFLRSRNNAIMAAGDAPVMGRPPRTGVPTDAALGGAIGAGACVAGGAALGAPQAGAALAPLCAGIGAKVAPYVKDGAIFVGKKIGAGAVEVGKGAAFVGGKIYDGTKEAAHVGLNFAENPIETSTHLAAGTVGVADRLVSAAYSNAPVPVKIALAPTVVVSKIASKTLSVADTAVSKISGGVKSLLGGGNNINCSVAQQPSNAQWCRQKYGPASAPGSDRWAREHGQVPLLSGPGST